MPYYKTTSGDVHFIESTEFEYLLPDSCVMITDTEADELQRPPTKTLRDQIVELESLQTDRRIREAVLGIDNGWLANLNNQIEALRSRLRMMNNTP